MKPRTVIRSSETPLHSSSVSGDHERNVNYFFFWLFVGSVIVGLLAMVYMFFII